ncbi:MAG TPA: phosphatidylserine decarboxylase family protein [Thermodesulfovibrionales bacterium]|nr:phosphatidylserine decarboxylase family protein [Thermodesulfovibrionales bacterium]
MIKLAPEGYPFITVFLVITIGTAVFFSWTAILPFMLTLFMAYFFRDPERVIPRSDNAFLAPADGKVILIEDLRGEKIPAVIPVQKGDETGYIGVSIFMSPLDVHVNRAPCDGVVESVVHTPGRFLSAFKHEASLRNENIAMLLDTKYGKVLVRQVAGFLARRAVCRVKTGDSLKGGERYGIIKFSSRLDIYLPGNTVIKVRLGERVKAGETVLGEIS